MRSPANSIGNIRSLQSDGSDDENVKRPRRRINHQSFCSNISSPIRIQRQTKYHTTSLLFLFSLLPCILRVQSLTNNPHPTSSSTRTTRQEAIRAYDYLSSEEIQYRLLEMGSNYPNLVTITTSQDLFHLPTAGQPVDCPYDPSTPGCKNWIIIIEDRISYSQEASSYYLPEVFLTSSLKGDERIGPTTLVETAELLLNVAHCESFPRTSSSNVTAREWEEDLSHSRSCRAELASRGISSFERRWLARLVATRRIVILPVANALGYYRNHPNEGHIDPERDFPFGGGGGGSSAKCMRTIAARTINELFRGHLFQLAITFYSGGGEGIGYEWGDSSHGANRAPDDESQKQISAAYSRIGGKFVKDGGNTYPFGPIREVFDDDGSSIISSQMQDWAYTGSWDPDRVVTCNHITTYGGYDPRKTTYPPGTLRTFDAMVRTSLEKEPDSRSLGTDEDLFTPMGGGNGHISRNIRLALLMVDLVEPYVTILSAQDVPLRDDIVPLSPRYSHSCQKTKVILIPEGGLDYGKLRIEWIVGGALRVDETRLMYAKWSDLDEFFDGLTQPTQQQLDAFDQILHEIPGGIDSIYVTEPQSGITQWHPDALHSYPEPIRHTFRAEIDARRFGAGDSIAVFAIAKVDSSWNTVAMTSSFKTPFLPQSHIVNARTNPEWRHESSDGTKIIQGRIVWYSIPLTIQIGSNKSPFEEISVRNPEEDVVASYYGVMMHHSEPYKSFRAIYVLILVTWGLLIVVLMRLRYTRMVRRRSDVRDRELVRLREEGGIELL